MGSLSEIREELDKLFPQTPDGRRDDVWVTREGKAIKIKDMSDKHLINALKLVKRRAQSVAAQKLDDPDVRWKQLVGNKFRNLVKEANYRGYSHWERILPKDMPQGERNGRKGS